MADNIMITRIWEDVDFFQIQIECKTDLVVIREKVYITDNSIDELCGIIEMFLSERASSFFWQNGMKGDDTTPCISMRFVKKDKNGHVLIEVFMEIDDGGKLSSHNCCFYINTEMGLLQRFKEKLPKIMNHQVGIQVSLNDDV